MSLGKNIAIVAGVWVGLNVVAFAYLSLTKKKTSVVYKPAETGIDRRVEEMASSWDAMLDEYESTHLPIEAGATARGEAVCILRALRKGYRESLREYIINEGQVQIPTHMHRMAMRTKAASWRLVDIGLAPLVEG